MSDQNEEAGVPPVSFFSPYVNEDIEIVDESELRTENEGDLAGKSREELIAEVQAMKQENSPVDTVAETAALRAELAAIKESAVTPQQMQAYANQQQQQPQQPVETEEVFNERIKSTMYDNPRQAMDEYYGKKLMPEVNRLAANNLYHSQKFLELDPERGANYKKYQKAIDAQVRTMTPQEQLYDPEIYQKAYQQVMVLHIDDTVAEAVKVALEAKEAEGGSKAKGNGVGSSHTEIGNGSPNPGARKKTKIALTDAEKKRAVTLGITQKDMAAIKARRAKK